MMHSTSKSFMGHLIQWDNVEKTVVLQQYIKGATKDDLYHLAEKSEALLRSVPHTVHLIVDETEIQLTLLSTDMKFLEKHVPSNQGAVVVVVNPSSMAYKKIVQDMGHQIAPKAFDHPFFTATVEQARKFLQEQLQVSYP